MEVIVVLAIALMVLGPKKLPEVGKSLGRGIREFKGSISGESDDERTPEELPAAAPAPATATAPAPAPRAHAEV